MTEQTFINPSDTEKKFLTKFSVSSSKIELYGVPSAMQSRSNLIGSMLDKLDVDGTNVLAENILVGNEESLRAVWLYLNLWDDKLDTEKVTPVVAIKIWPWLNYFDVPYKDRYVSSYLYVLVNEDEYFDEFMKPENRIILNDIMSKIKLINKYMGEALGNKIKRMSKL